jgi:hypothetical protein
VGLLTIAVCFRVRYLYLALNADKNQHNRSPAIYVIVYELVFSTQMPNFVSYDTKRI